MKQLFFLFALCFSVLLSAQDWSKTYSDALAIATKEEKPILLVFSGSDWCGPCIKLDKKIWQSEEFAAYSKEVVPYKADFPKRKANKLPEELSKANAALAEKFNPDGYFPLVILLDKNQKVLGKTGYNTMSPPDYIAHLITFVK